MFHAGTSKPQTLRYYDLPSAELLPEKNVFSLPLFESR
jgi:hypothetical protein